MPIPTLITDLSQTAGSNYPAGSDSPSVLDDVQRAHAGFIAQLRDGKGQSTPLTLASATTTDIGGQNSQFVEISGTTTITSLGTNYTGVRYLRFTGVLTLTHNSTAININGGASIVTVAGDTAIATPNIALNGWNVFFVNNSAVSKNMVINSNFAINQRAVSGTVTLAAGIYGHDRWKAGSGGCTYTFSTTANVTTITISAGTLQQVVEGSQLFSGTHCLSWTGTATGRIDSGSYGSSGVTATATGGTNMTVEFGTGTVSKVKLEFSGSASAWGLYSGVYGSDFQACQRYYETIDARHFNYEMYSLSGGLAAHVNSMFKVTKRAVPTIFQPTPASQAASSTLTVTGTVSGIDFSWIAGSGVAFVLFTTGTLFTASIEL